MQTPNHAPGAGPLGSGSPGQRRAIMSSSPTRTSSRPRVPEAEARTPRASNDGRRKDARELEIYQKRADDRLVVCGRSTVAFQGRRHEREAQGGQPGRPGLLAAQDYRLTIDPRRGRRDRSPGRATAAFLGGGRVQQRAFVADGGEEALAELGRPTGRLDR